MTDSGPPSNDDANARLPLDRLIESLEDNGCGRGRPRPKGFRETSAHANPLMLASADGDSDYVRAWRDHARRCPACRKLFAFFDLAL